MKSTTYNPSTGTVAFWVRIPTLSHAADTTIYMWYGNSAVVASQENLPGVWRSGFSGVYHLSNGTVLSPADSLNLNNGTNEGVTATSGMIGGAGSFNGGSSYITLPAAAFGNYEAMGWGTTNYTLSFETWFKTAKSGVILGQDDGRMPGSNPGGWVPAIYVDTAGQVRGSMFWHGAASSQLVSNGTYTDNQWHSLVDTYNKGTEILYIDGQALGTQTVQEVAYATNFSYFLGAGETTSWPALPGGWSYFNGGLDEARISAVARSADWIATEYNNQASPSTFYRISSGVGGTDGGGSVTFSDPNAAVTHATFSSPGTYVLQLSGSDTQYTSTSQVTVTVYPPRPPNQPPVVSAGPSQTINLPSSARLAGAVSGNSSLPQGAIVNIQWSLLSGPAAVVFGNASQPSTTATFSQAGTYVLQLSASNTQYTSFSTVTITVNSVAATQNQPPVVSATAPSPAVVGSALALNATATDDGLPNGTLIVQWAQLSGPGTATFSNANMAATQVTFNAAGTYVLQLSACDSQYTSSVTLTVPVVTSTSASNEPPVVSAGVSQTIILPTNSVSLNGLITDSSLSINQLSIAWTAVSGPASVVFSNPYAASTQATFAKAGVYLLQLSANDGQHTATSTTTVVVNAPQSG